MDEIPAISFDFGTAGLPNTAPIQFDTSFGPTLQNKIFYYDMRFEYLQEK